jgi:hypothetical protein
LANTFFILMWCLEMSDMTNRPLRYFGSASLSLILGLVTCLLTTGCVSDSEILEPPPVSIFESSDVTITYFGDHKFLSGLWGGSSISLQEVKIEFDANKPGTFTPTRFYYDNNKGREGGESISWELSADRSKLLSLEYSYELWYANHSSIVKKVVARDCRLIRSSGKEAEYRADGLLGVNEFVSSDWQSHHDYTQSYVSTNPDGEPKPYVIVKFKK